MTVPFRKSSPPHTPHGSRRSSALSRQRRRAGHGGDQRVARPGQLPQADPAALPPVLPPPGSEAERAEVELLTKLDLAKEWRAYQARRKGENFYQFTEKHLRRRRDVGRYTAMAGIGGVLRKDGPTPMTVAGYAIVGVSGVVTLVGAVVWGVYYRRLERLEGAESRYYTLGPRGRVRLHGGGLGLRLTF